MAEPLKLMYNVAFFERLCPLMKRVIPGFDCQHFIRLIFNNQWPELELKERVRHISKCLTLLLPSDFLVSKPIIEELTDACIQEGENGFAMMFLADYIELNGQEHPDEALDAMEKVTQLISCEFAIRPFLLRYPEKTFKRMLKWSKHESHHVRRLASEGCRPRLPWGMGIPALKKDPSPIIPILENLKKDESDFVCRSVANNLNDIAKDHPQLVLKLISKWKSKHPSTTWIIKHGCRTLLKRGNSEVLQFHGFNPKSKSALTSLTLSRPAVKIGDHLHFEFEFINKEKNATPFRLEYAIDYLTSTGKISRKIFKITENEFAPGKKMLISRKQSFKNFTTRKHFKGKHLLTVLANGKKLATKEFMVQ